MRDYVKKSMSSGWPLSRGLTVGDCFIINPGHRVMPIT